MTDSTTTTEFGFNPFDPDYLRDPYPTYAQLRDNSPYFIELFGTWLLGGHAETVHVLRHPRFGHWPEPSEFEELLAGKATAEERAAQRLFLTYDPPDHTRLRGLVAKAFTPRSVEDLRPKVEAFVAGALDEAAARGEMDVMADLAFPLPFAVICEMLGVPTEGRAEMRRMSQALIGASGFMVDSDKVEASNAAGLEFIAFMRDLINARRKQPSDDLLSRLIAVEEQGEVLTEEELWGTALLVLIAGFETTVNLVGNGTWALLQHPDQAARLRADPALDRPAVEELLRWDSPVQMTVRRAMEDMEINGAAVEKGQQVALFVAAANHDPRVFDEPERLDVARTPNPHLSFGNGIHFCLGAPLARLEASVAIPALFRRFPGVEFAGDAPEWNGNQIFRGLRSLPVAVG